MEYWKILVTVVTAAAGWVFAHYFTSRRDTENSCRATRVAALTNCYKALVRSALDGTMLKKGQDGRVVNNAAPVEDAIALIHLYGDQEQSDLASAYARDVANTGTGDATILANSLRKDIRHMLGSEDLNAVPAYLKVTTREPD